jgi:hypothetical protein
MRPVSSSITEVDNLSASDEVQFSISATNSAWVMRSMADLYSDRETAVIREYSTNARDAMIDANKKHQPIHVTLPSIMHPYFSVQDFGVGMSIDQLKEVYTQFGESTKRESDEVNGMLGFGSKSGIAYTNTFTIESVKNHRKVIALVVRREDSNGGYLVTMKIIQNEDTADGNGVKIQIPVHNHQEFLHKANNFYKYWIPGTVLVNQKEPKWEVGKQVSENMYYTPDAEWSYVVMGNVPYRINNPKVLFPAGMNPIKFVAYVPNGAVEFTPSREDLKYSPHTNDSLANVVKNFADNALTLARKEINGAGNHWKAYDNWTHWRNVLGEHAIGVLNYKGSVLPTAVRVSGLRYNRSAYRNSVTNVESIRIDNIRDRFFVTDFPSDKVSTSQKTKLRSWVDGFVRVSNPNFNPQQFVFTADNKVDSIWVNPSDVVSWETVKAQAPAPLKKPKVTQSQWRKAGTFDLVNAAGLSYERDVPSTKPLYFIMTKNLNDITRTTMRRLLADFDVKEDIVIVGANRYDKFIRNYGYAVDIMTYLKSRVNFNGPSMVSADAKFYETISYADRQILIKLNVANIVDPHVSKMLRVMNIGEPELYKEYNRQSQLARSIGLFHQFVLKDVISDSDYVTQNYPLSNMVRSNNSPLVKRHTEEYINAVFTAEKSKNV